MSGLGQINVPHDYRSGGVETTQVPLYSTYSQRNPKRSQNPVHNNPETDCSVSDHRESVRNDNDRMIDENCVS